ncbi:MAG: hypothetical protein HQM14_19640 [SAR324 cluster bacterium]|nr:hypothetical protein [SAR324 cluster bacterium]
MNHSIGCLTDEQSAKTPEFLDKWLKICLSTQCSDFDKAKQALTEFYKNEHLKPPDHILLLQSPISAAIGAHILNFVGMGIGDELLSRRMDRFKWTRLMGVHHFGKNDQFTKMEHLWNLNFNSVNLLPEEHFTEHVQQFWKLNLEQFQEQFGNQILDQIQNRIKKDGLGQIKNSWPDIRHSEEFYYEFDLRIAFEIDYFFNVAGCKTSRRIQKILIELAKHCGGWLFYKNIAILYDRPQSIVFDQNHLLHNETGKAIQYQDGFGVYSWHGVQVPCEWIESEPPVDDILNRENIEQRRAGCEILGWNKILSKLGARSIQKDKNPQVGELLEVDLHGSGRERFLKVKCGTGRDFVIPVPVDCETARQANAWTYGLIENEFNVEVRT